MEAIMINFDMFLKNVRGKNEFEIYKNYINDLPEKRLDQCFNAFFRKSQLKEKDNSKATMLRNDGNKCYTKRTVDFERCLQLYTKSLCYSTYNGQEYAMALANRSAVYFALEDYKSCIIDINFCLKANYPNSLKPKVLIRKANCLKKMGDVIEMRITLIDALNASDDLPDLIREKYRKTICNLLLITKIKAIPPITDDNTTVNLPEIEENKSFINASTSVRFRYDKRKGHSVLASKDIKRGEILFVEKAFAFTPIKAVTNIELWCSLSELRISPVHVQKSCQYCLTLLTNCIPCKTCVKHVYCNEQCRDFAWKAFHQWECYAIRANMISVNNHGYLAVRIIFKAMSTALCTSNVNFEEIKYYGNKDDNYPFVYNLPRNISKIKKELLMTYAATAAFWVRYLRKQTDFFEHMKELPTYVNKNEKELLNQIGGLIIRHCCQLHTNTIPIKVISKQYFSPKHILTGITVCPSATIMRHSCLPNTAHYFIKDVLVVKATEDIKMNEEIFRSYTSVITTSTNITLTHALENDRKTMLRNLCFLNCKCRVCVDPRLNVTALNAYLCMRCKGPAINKGERFMLFDKEYICLDCNYKCLFTSDLFVKDSFVEHFLIKFKIDGDIEDGNRCLDMARTIYVSTHPLFVEIYNALYRYHFNRGNIKEFLKSAKMLIMVCKKRRVNFVVEAALVAYHFSAVAIEVLQKLAIYITVQELGQCLKIVTEFLTEVKDVLNLYYPPFVPKVDVHLETIRELRILHTLCIANKRD